MERINVSPDFLWSFGPNNRDKQLPMRQSVSMLTLPWPFGLRIKRQSSETKIAGWRPAKAILLPTDMLALRNNCARSA